MSGSGSFWQATLHQKKSLFFSHEEFLKSYYQDNLLRKWAHMSAFSFKNMHHLFTLYMPELQFIMILNLFTIVNAWAQRR